ncbi:acyltransferase family protein [Thalassotalea agariperforans]
MQYREDINGLRAIAVLPIVLFHAGIETMTGGFIGVDIFFVISGYLISKIIISELKDDKFRLIEFYKRRTIRIFPALLFMLSALLTASLFLSLPSELAQLNNSVIATSFSLSNIYFWFVTDYFSPAAELQPLLHTWSLGIEEQFYLFYPIILLLIHKYFNKRYTIFIVSIIIISLMLSWFLSFKDAEAGFYLLPSRAWELALGGLVAINFFPKVKSAKIINALFLFGLTCIFIGLFWIKPSYSFPFPWALIPCLGTFVLLAYGDNASFSKLLSFTPLQFTGKISYSLYLWHWPIITLYRIETGIELDLLETISLVTTSFIFAIISYYLVERFFLKKYKKSSAAKNIVMTGILALALFCICSSFFIKNIEKFRATPESVLRVDSFNDYRETSDYLYQFRTGSPCFRGSEHRHIPFDTNLCVLPQENTRNIVVLGDSHAAQLWRAFKLKYSEANVMQATASGCRPLLEGKGADYCLEVVKYVLGPMLKNNSFDTIILSGRWRSNEITLLKETVSFLIQSGIKVIVIGSTVEYHGEFPALLARALKKNDLQFIHSKRDKNKEQLDLKIKSATLSAGGHFISLHESECPLGNCKLTTDDNSPMHFDYGHLTLSAAKWHISRMDDF